MIQINAFLTHKLYFLTMPQEQPARSDTIFALAHEGKKYFTVSHVTIRQSIVFLISKLILIDIFSAAVLLMFFLPIATPLPVDVKIAIISNRFAYFAAVVTAKTILSIYIVLLWLNNYYELTSEIVTHRYGIFWQKEESFKVTHIKNYGIRQGIFGKLFNYGDLHFYDWFLQQEYSMYQVHNPRKYLKILEDMLPFADEDKELIREHMVEPGDE